MVRPCHGLGLVCFAAVAAAASATQFRVGGQKGWSVPGAGAEPYNSWAGRLRFQIGDQLLFVYPKETDSVLLVEPAAYNACNTSAYASRFDDGATVFTFDRTGPFFFISGNESNCRANEKLIVVVLADRTGTRTPPAPPATPPPPSSPPPSAAVPAPAPATTPSSAPTPAGLPPASAPTTTPSSPPSPAAPSPTGSAPASAPTTTPSSPPSPTALAPSPSTSPATPGGDPQPPSSSGSNTTTPTPRSTNDQTGAGTLVVAGFLSSLGAFIGYAMLAV